jgi:hypothetical protein
MAAGGGSAKGPSAAGKQANRPAAEMEAMRVAYANPPLRTPRGL